MITDVVDHISNLLYSDKIIYVDPSGNSGLFDKIADAVAHALTLSPSTWNQITIILRTGQHTVDNSGGPLLIPYYVNIIGEQGCVVSPTTAGNDLFHTQAFVYLANFFIQGPTSATAIKQMYSGNIVIENVWFYACLNGFKMNIDGQSQLKNCTFEGCTGIGADGATSGASLYAQDCKFGGNGTAVRAIDIDRMQSNSNGLIIDATGGWPSFIKRLDSRGDTKDFAIDGGAFCQFADCAFGGSVKGTIDAGLLVAFHCSYANTTTGLILTNGALNINYRLTSGGVTGAGNWDVDLFSGSTYLNVNGFFDQTENGIRFDASSLGGMINGMAPQATGIQFQSNNGSTMILSDIFAGFSASNVVIDCNDGAVFGFDVKICLDSSTTQINQQTGTSTIQITGGSLDTTKLNIVNTATCLLDIKDNVSGGDRARRVAYAANAQTLASERTISLTIAGLNMTLPASVGASHANHPIYQTYRDEFGAGGILTAPGAETINGGAFVAIPVGGTVNVYGFTGTWFTY